MKEISKVKCKDRTILENKAKESSCSKVAILKALLQINILQSTLRKNREAKRYLFGLMSLYKEP